MPKIPYKRRFARHLHASVFSAMLFLGAGSMALADGQIYRIGSNDVLLVTVYGQPSLTGLYPVDVDGNIGYPLSAAFPFAVSRQLKSARRSQRLCRSIFRA